MRVRRRGDDILVTLAAEEAGVLVALAKQTHELIDADTAEPADPLEAAVGIAAAPAAEPEDPAVARLFPAAYGGDSSADEAAAAEFRRLMHADLQRQKADALAAVLADLDLRQRRGGRPTEVVLTLEQVERWMQAINDVRLVIGVRADVQEDMEAVWATLTPDDPRGPLLVAYDFLTYLQQSLIEAVDPAAATD